MENTMSSETMIFYAIGALFIGFIIIGLARDSGRYSKPLQSRPEMQTGRQTAQAMPDLQGNFDANALNTAKVMASELERYPDPTSRTLALAEMIFRTEQMKLRNADRVFQEQKRESDMAERLISAVTGRLSGGLPAPQYQDYRGPAFPDPRAQRINNYHQNRQIAEQNYWDGGFYK